MSRAGLLRTLRRGLPRLSRSGDRAIELKTPGELDAMRAAGLVVAGTLALLAGHARAGVSTGQLDELAEQSIRDAGAVPSFKGYQIGRAHV